MQKYEYDYSPESAAGHLVGMLSARASGGVVVDLGCGNAPLAGPLQAAGFAYVGYDLDAGAVAALLERGIDARLCDLAVDDPADLVDDALEGRPLAAIIAVDVIEHVPGFERLLASLSRVVDRHTALLGVSIPNVTHEDLAVKLVAGRWDITDTGLLDSTHLNLFDERRLDQAMSTAGFDEVERDDMLLERTEQGLLHQHPFVYPHTAVGEWLRRLRTMSGSHSSTYQFVRLYRARPAGAPFDGTPPSSPLDAPSFTVVVLPVADADLGATLASIGAQRLAAADVVVAAADLAPEAVLVDALTTTASHVCFVEAGDVVPEGWLEGFERTLRDHPARVARQGVRPRFEGGLVGGGLFRSVLMCDEPLHAFAVPLAPSKWLQLGEARGPDAIWTWVVRTTSMVGLADVESTDWLPSVAPRSGAGLLDSLGADALLLPVGWHHEVAAIRLGLDRQAAEHEAELQAERERAGDLARTIELLRGSFWWRITVPGRRSVEWLRGRRKT